GATGAHGFYLLERNFFDGFGEQLADEADGSHCECQHTGQSTKTYRLYENNGHNHRMQRTAKRDDRPGWPCCPSRHEVARTQQADGKGKQNAERGRKNGNFQAFRNTLPKNIQAFNGRGEETTDEASAEFPASFKALPGKPQLGGRIDGIHQYGKQAETGAPRQRKRLNLFFGGGVHTSHDSPP